MFVSGAIGLSSGKVVFGGDVIISGSINAIGGGTSGTNFFSSTTTDAIFATGSLAIRGGESSVDAASDKGADVFFYVSGTVGGTAATSKKALFGGDTVISGSARVIGNQISGSAGGNITLQSTGIVVSGITGSNASITGDVTVGGNLTVNGTTTTVNTVNLVVRDPVVLIGSGSVSSNSNGGIAIASGSTETNKSLVFGRVANDVWGAGKLDVTNGTATTLAIMDLVGVRAGKLEIGGSTAYLTTSLGNTVGVMGTDFVLSSGKMFLSGAIEQGLKSLASTNYAVAMGLSTTASNVYAHSQGQLTVASGQASHAEGFRTNAIGAASHAEGNLTVASGTYSLAAGIGTIASGSGQSVFGAYNLQGNDYSLFVIGDGTSTSARADVVRVDSNGLQVTGSAWISNGISGSHTALKDGRSFLVAGSNVTITTASDGQITIDSSGGGGGGGDSYFSSTTAGSIFTTGSAAFIGSESTVDSPSDKGADVFFYVSGTRGSPAGSERKSLFGGDVIISGSLNVLSSSGVRSTKFEIGGATAYLTGVTGATTIGVMGSNLVFSSNKIFLTGAIEQGFKSLATTNTAVAMGLSVTASANYTFAGGQETQATAILARAVGYRTIASQEGASANGSRTLASGLYSFTHGLLTTGSGNFSHAEGLGPEAIGSGSHAEGNNTFAIGYTSHTEGQWTYASGSHSHAEGSGSIAIGRAAHAEGLSTRAEGTGSHSQGDRTIAYGTASFAGGTFTIASGSGQTVFGSYNLRGNDYSLFVIGNGTGDDNVNRSDVLRVESSGLQVTGSLYVTNGITGSHTTLADGRSFLVAGNNVTIVSASDGQITISSTGGGGGGDTYFSSVTAGEVFTTGSIVSSGSLSIKDGSGNSVFSASTGGLINARRFQLSGSSGITGSLVIQDDLTSVALLTLSSSAGSATLNETSAGDFEIRNTKFGGNMTFGLRTSMGNAVNFMTVRPNGAAVSTLVSILPSIYAGPANPVNSSDTNFFVGGTVGSRGGANRGAGVFGGDLVVSGSAHVLTGISVTGSIAITGNIMPDADKTQDLGSPSMRWANVYTGDLHLRNERGDYTLIEEEDFLSIRFNKTGKRYRFLLEPVPELDEEPLIR
jgi:hypothetical protein